MQKRNDLTGFGARLRQLREERNISQKDMIKMVNDYYGVERFKTIQAFNRYEIYGAQPDIKMLKCFSHILNVSIDYLIENQSPLNQCIAIVRRNGCTCKDDGEGFVRLLFDEKDEKIEAVFSYDDFIALVNEVELSAQCSYRSTFGFTFFQELLIYGYQHYDMVDYAPKNKKAYNMNSGWIRFNELKSIMKKVVQDTEETLQAEKDGDK